MNIEEDVLIQNFLKNTLPENERKVVLRRIEIDESFREKVNFEKQLFLNLNDNEWSVSSNTNHSEIKLYEKLLRTESSKALKKTLTEVNKEYQLIQNKKKKQSWLLYSGAAAIVFLIGLTFLFPQKTSSNQLYKNNINLAELPSLINRGKNEKKPLIKAQKLFENKEYHKALNILLIELDSVQKNKAILYLYTGISQMELNQFNDAENTFDELINSDLIDASKGKWYKALSFIKQNKLQEAKKLLEDISKSPENYKYKTAAELLEKLE